MRYPKSIITVTLFVVFSGCLLLFGHPPSAAQAAPLIDHNAFTGQQPDLAQSTVQNALRTYAIDVAVLGDWAYVTKGCGGFDTVNVSNPLQPLLKGHLDLPTCVYTLKVANHYAYAACPSAECDLQIIDVSNPISPSLSAQYGTRGYIDDIALTDQRAYLVRLTGFDILDLTNPISPTLLGRYTISNDLCTGKAFNIVVKGPLAYLTTRDDLASTENPCGTLQIIDVSNPTRPTRLATFQTGAAYGVQVIGKLAYLTYQNAETGNASLHGTGGLQVIDVSTPVSPTLIGQYRAMASPYTIQITDKWAYIANGDAGIAIVDISNPVAPMLRANYPTTGYAHKAQVVGNFIYVAADQGGLEIIGTSDALVHRIFLPLVHG